MTSTSRRELEDYGLARVRDVAFDAVQKLWRRRREAGATQKTLADTLDRDPSWVSRQLSGPGNWTFRSFGALVEALDGEVEILVHALEDPIIGSNNYDAYRHADDRNDLDRRSLGNVSKQEYGMLNAYISHTSEKNNRSFTINPTKSYISREVSHG